MQKATEMKPRVLLVDDDVELLDLLRDYLDGEGFVWLSKNAFSKPGNELIPAFRTHGSL